MAETIEKPKAQALVGETSPEPGGRWELRLTIRTKMIGVGAIRAVADFVRIGAQFAGQTQIAIGAKGRELPGRLGDIEGEMTASDVALDLQVQEGFLKAYRFHCTGQAVDDGARYEGSWHAPCVHPGDCNCDGTTDEFVMVRLDETGDGASR